VKQTDCARPPFPESENCCTRKNDRNLCVNVSKFTSEYR